MTDYAKEPDKWLWGPEFSVQEFTCKGSGQCLMDASFMSKLLLLRRRFAEKMVVTSGYRSPAYNAQVAHTGENGPHTTGCAVDIAIRGWSAHRLLTMALAAGFTGIGIKQSGEGRFIHLDDLPALPNRPRPTIWSY